MNLSVLIISKYVSVIWMKKILEKKKISSLPSQIFKHEQSNVSLRQKGDA